MSHYLTGFEAKCNALALACENLANALIMQVFRAVLFGFFILGKKQLYQQGNTISQAAVLMNSP